MICERCQEKADKLYKIENGNICLKCLNEMIQEYGNVMSKTDNMIFVNAVRDTIPKK